MVRAYEAGKEFATRWEDAHTVAAGIRVPAAVGDFLILRAVRESGGFATAVSDADIEQARVDAAQDDGLLLCPEGAATFAAYRQSLADGQVSRDDRVVLFNCGSGLKYPMPDQAGFVDADAEVDHAGLLAVPDVLITEFMEDAAVAILAEHHEVRYDPHLVDDRAALLGLLGEARALIVRNQTRVDVEALEAAPHLRAVGRLGVGLDNIDVLACEHRSIAVLPATGANAVAVAEYVVTALLVLRRQGVFQATPRLLAGEWPQRELVGHDLAGCRVALLGLGGIARLVADRLQAFDVEVVGLDPFVAEDDAVWEQVERADTLPALLGSADALSIHVPLTADTQHVLDADGLALLPPHAVVVDTARGGIVDEAALCDALKAGRLGGAALDVFETEPPDPAALARFADVPNLILTPHVAGVTVESNQAVSALVAERIREVLDAVADEVPE